ncbi:MAG: pyroglutamyl-peptidase [Planctomycetota bacterium]|jgi:pyroglutamyl-peptidase
MLPMPKPFLLVTGFGAFEAVETNPSGAIASSLDARPDVLGLEIPVSFTRGPAAMDQALASLPAPPAGILSIGVHPGPEFRLERRARSGLSSERPDNDGDLGSSLGWSGADLATTLDLEAMLKVLHGPAAQPSARLSDDAGRYVCECIYRHALTRGNELGIPALFLHVPPLESLALASQRSVVEALVDAYLDQV